MRMIGSKICGGWNARQDNRECLSDGVVCYSELAALRLSCELFASCANVRIGLSGILEVYVSTL